MGRPEVPRGRPFFGAGERSSLFRSLSGLADGLALKELRYAAEAGDSPHLLGSPITAGMWGGVQRRFRRNFDIYRQPARTAQASPGRHRKPPPKRGLSVAGL